MLTGKNMIQVSFYRVSEKTHINWEIIAIFPCVANWEEDKSLKVNFILILEKNTMTQPNSSNYSSEKTDGLSDGIVLKYN